MKHTPHPNPLPGGERGLEALFADILATADRPLEDAVSLPAAAYTSDAFAAWEAEHLFRNDWVALCHASELPGVGDFIRFEYLGEHLAVVHGDDGQVRVVSPNDPFDWLAWAKRGRSAGLAAMRGVHEQPRFELFEGFVFVTFSADAPPVSAKLAGLRDRFIGRWGMSSAVAVWSREWEPARCRFNWKAIAENFMEYYHHMGAHAKTLEAMLPARGCYTEPVQAEWCAAHLPLNPELAAAYRSGAQRYEFPVFPELTDDDRGKWWVFLGMPSFLLFVAPDRIFWMRNLPHGPRHCELCHVMLVHPSALEQPDYAQQHEAATDQLEEIHLEDVEMCTGVQRGVESAGWTAGRLSHLDEPVWQIQQYLARKIREAQP